MGKKAKNDHYAGLAFIVIFLLLTVVTVAFVFILSGTLIWVSGGIASAFFGVLGFGSFVNPTINDWAGRIFDGIAKGFVESSNSHENKQTQKDTTSSNQIMTGSGKTKITINQVENGKSSIGQKMFSCPKGHGCKVFPPDDIHPIASREEEYAKKNAEGTVIPMSYTCNGCGGEFTLYWYRQAIHATTGRNIYFDKNAHKSR